MTKTQRIRESLQSVNASLSIGKSSNNVDIKSIVDEYTTIYRSYMINHGYIQTIKNLKQIYSIANHVVIGYKIEPTTQYWLGLRKNGIPKVLKGEFLRLLSSPKMSDKRSALSFLRVFEIFQIQNPEIDRESISYKGIGKEYYRNCVQADFIRYMERSPWASSIKQKYNRAKGKVSNRFSADDEFLHYSTKMGPRGLSVATCGKQAADLTKTKIIPILGQISKYFNRRTWMFVLNENADLFNQTQFDLSQTHRCYYNTDLIVNRVAAIPDKGGKVRTMAICNYWIQDAMKPFHDTIYKVFDEMPNDGTHDQDALAGTVKKWSSEGPVWSHDLTSATDRIPKEIMIDIIKFLDGPMGIQLELLLDELTFWTPEGILKYETGQPMGLYGSWALLNIWHHFMFQYCGYKTGTRNITNRYVVLGDDSACCNHKMSAMYENLITNLDIPISAQKSLIPDQKNPNSKLGFAAEFAKRIYLDGKEITGLAPGLSVATFGNRGNLENYPTLLTQLISKDYIKEYARLEPDDILNRPLDLIQLNVSKRRKLNILMILRIWDILTATDVVKFEIPGIEDRDELLLLVTQARCSNLRNTFGTKWAGITTSVQWLLEEVVNLNPEDSELYYYNIVIDSRRVQLDKLFCELSSKIYMPVDDAEDMQLFLNGIEYAPFMDYVSLTQGKPKCLKKYRLRNMYIKLLANTVDGILNNKFED